MSTEKRMGRPPYQPTMPQRQKVEQCAAIGMSHVEIGSLLDIDRHTVEKYFPDELAHGALRYKAEAMELLVQSARKGNVSAQKRLYELASSTVAAGEVRALANHVIKPKLGKKEQANVDARTAGAGTEWEEYLRMDSESLN